MAPDVAGSLTGHQGIGQGFTLAVSILKSVTLLTVEKHSQVEASPNITRILASKACMPPSTGLKVSSMIADVICKVEKKLRRRTFEVNAIEDRLRWILPVKLPLDFKNTTTLK